MSLRYGQALPSLVSPSASPASGLAGLQLLARTQSSNERLTGLKLRVELQDGEGNPHRVELPLQLFLNAPELIFARLSPGTTVLDLSLLGADKRELAQMQTRLVLSGNQVAQLDFSLLEPVAGQLVLQWGALPSGNADAPTRPFPETPLSSPSVSPHVPDTGSNSAHSPESSAFDLRVVDIDRDSASLAWQTPPGADIASYRILLDGEEIAVTSSTQWGLDDLDPQTRYQVEVIPLRADGSAWPPLALSLRTLASGGGGGGGGSSPPVDTPPLIVSLTPSQTQVSGLGYPVALRAVASDDQPLNDAAYTWSCDNCGAGSFFDRSDGPSVIWTAPTSPGSYTVRLSVSDGVNPPVSTTQTLIVEHLLADVIVIGEYE
ncbi:MAG: fibronectin type III domain-containing protein [Candidatus Sericytochromatia bacterium]